MASQNRFDPAASETDQPELIQLEGIDGTVVSDKLPRPSAKLGPSVFSFALHKSGSVLLDNIMLDLCGTVGLPAISIDGICFRGGLRLHDLRPEPAISLLSRPGYCFYGFRGLHGFMYSMDLGHNKKIILVRDPRDILTSYFFSMRYSHSVPPVGKTRTTVLAQREVTNSQTIDEYVLSQNVTFIHTNYHRYIALEGPMTKVFRYEDVIFTKRDWVKTINDWFALGASDEAVAAIAARHDILPDREDPHSHIRQVTPGNYKKHLAPGTIERIEDQYRVVMAHYGYV
jgi:hypothetical protein